MKNLKEKLTILIHENEGDFNDSENLSQFVNDYIYGDRELEDLQDYVSEWADSEVPVYNHAIIDEWRGNSSAQGATEEAIGEAEASTDVYKLMKSDLFFFIDYLLIVDN